MITLNLFESNWLDSFQQIDVLKSVNKLYLGQNNKKINKFSFFKYLICLLFKSGKILRPNLPRVSRIVALIIKHINMIILFACLDGWHDFSLIEIKKN